MRGRVAGAWRVVAGRVAAGRDAGAEAVDGEVAGNVAGAVAAGGAWAWFQRAKAVMVMKAVPQ